MSDKTVSPANAAASANVAAHVAANVAHAANDSGAAASPAVRVTGLHVTIGGKEIIHGVDLTIPRDATVAVVGESGSGKSVTAKTLSGLLPDRSDASGDYALFGEPINLEAGERAWRRLRGGTIVWLPQDPFSSLDPLRTCGRQIEDGLRSAGHVGSLPAQDVDNDRTVAASAGGSGNGGGAPAANGRGRLTKAQRRAAVERLLTDVGLAPAVYDAYPHELSGGMRQRVAIAAALAPDPRILIADEPTTALDASTQETVLDLLESLRSSRHMTLLLITHDLALAVERADHLVVFHGGQVVEEGGRDQVVHHPRSPYTRELLDAHTRLAVTDVPAFGDVVMRANHLRKTFAGSNVPAVADVSFDVRAGEILGLVGESGSGKSTVARCIVGLETPDSGNVVFTGNDGKPIGWSRGEAQLVFQNPYGSLNPTMTVRQTLTEALRVSGKPADDAAVRALVAKVGLEAELIDRKPGTLSGGQCQRVAIARALAPEPKLLVADEAVTALDANIQTHVLETLLELRSRLGLAMLFISHDLDTVRRIADRIAVMRHGRIVETGTTGQVMNHPQHDYVRALIAAMPPALD
ncbi:ABC transporter ATP-binding protein [Bifidobacterium amazonense]|uniref:ABC transporter ATP-binding protein n=1 Tax=Bifidobacterium amazonense TaxID=2809027 RepID=A0ABS9VRW4_9BIFI|nr:ABC transporter ATP-binding protein [Bifidobacterium amazonense]MCH9274829.1 ABC transporter ATP-binding protein [Bifidobacterium amazonense]